MNQTLYSANGRLIAYLTIAGFSPTVEENEKEKRYTFNTVNQIIIVTILK